MSHIGHSLVSALREPNSVLHLGLAEWNDLLWSARRHALLARLGITLEETGAIDRIPAKARELVADACVAAEANRTVQGHEVRRVLRALDGLGMPVVLLKGGAYLMAELPPARGRLSGDLDILVPHDRLDEVEAALLAHGWRAHVTEGYDQHYYRAWTHQLPPLRHAERSTELDVHHTIAPPTSRARADARALLRDARSLDDPRLKVLVPADMVLHSAVHLFNEEMATGLRDLLDLHDLLNHFGRSDTFWPQLADRARLHGLERPLYYCVRYAERFYGTPVPAAFKAEVASFGPAALVRSPMDWLVPLAILPDPPGGPRRWARLARWLLFVRSHWLRMPPGLLARHLLVKSLRRARPPGWTAHAPQP